MTKLAVVFPGQGSQSVGMLHDVIEAEEVARATFSEASSALGYDLLQLIQSGPEEKLNQTEFTQPALLTASVAMWRLAMARGVRKPDLLAGHSLGEYSALVASGVINFEDAVRLVQKRGQFMQSAVPLGEGGMAAILGLEDDQVVEICNQCSDDDSLVQAANFNAPGQIVIAGKADALARAIEKCKESGAKRAMPLAVSAPFHSKMMKPAADSMQQALKEIDFSAPHIPIIQNIDAEYEVDPGRIRDNLVRQMSGAVLWTGTIQRMVGDGVSCIMECGPGRVLSGLNKRIDRSLVSLGISDMASLEKSLESLNTEE